MEKITIIGAGPAGLGAAIYAGRALINPLVVEGMSPGGQLTTTSEVENYPGFPKGILGVELMMDMRQQAERFSTRFKSGEVKSIKKIDGGFELSLSSGETINSKTVLVATGAEAKWLGLESEVRLKNKGISACATCDGFFFKDKQVAVIGGGDTAMEEALFLTKYAAKVIIIHRKETFRASKIMADRVLSNTKIKIEWNKETIEFLGDERLSGIKLKDTVSGEESEIEIGGAFVAIGRRPGTKFLEDTGVLMDELGYLYTSQRAYTEKEDSSFQSQFNRQYKYQTNIPGLFAAGDCTDHVYRQAAVAGGAGVAAEIEIERYLEEK
ncbi:MAG: thioredoxin-disulfide reductase [Clostridia bacterium]|nr:thioredoxin-disulfide reductase [Clostridia bacterium]